MKKSVSREIRLLALLSNTSKQTAGEKNSQEDAGGVSMVYDSHDIVQQNLQERGFALEVILIF